MTKAPDWRAGNGIILDGIEYLILAIGTHPITGTTHVLLRDAEGNIYPRAYPPYFEAYTFPSWEAATMGIAANLP